MLSHGFLLQRVWGPERVGEPWAIRDVVKRLRRKLGEEAHDPPTSSPSGRVGYRMVETETPQLEEEPLPDSANGGG